MGFFTMASLKWSTTAAIAKTPPSRSYRLFSGAVCADCPWASSAAANKVAGAAAAASPATTLRLVTGVISLSGATELGKFELDDCMGTSFVTVSYTHLRAHETPEH